MGQIIEYKHQYPDNLRELTINVMVYNIKRRAHYRLIMITITNKPFCPLFNYRVHYIQIWLLRTI